MLPNHRGLNAQMWSIFDQDSTSGITWHLVSSGIDCGDIIIQKSIPLDSTYTYLKLTQEQLQLAFLAFREICDSLLSWNLPLKTQEKIGDFVLHKARDLPNNGILDLHWDFEKKKCILAQYGLRQKPPFAQTKDNFRGQKICDFRLHPKSQKCTWI